MSVSYVDTVNGSDTSNPLGTEAAPRRTLPTQADGLWVRIRRGSRFDRTTQYAVSSQGMIISDYGPPEAPKPILSALQPASSASFIQYGDTAWANIAFDTIDRSASETTVGQNTVTLGRRGNGASPTQCVSGVFVGCSFAANGGNAVNAGVMASDAEYAQGSPVVMMLACDFDGIGNDCFYGTIVDYLEVAYCTAKNLGTRSDSASDFVNTIYSDPKYVWVHDNLIDRSTGIDLKHAIVLDCAAGRTGGLAVIERNIILTLGAASPYTQAAANAGINTEMRAIVKHNYIRGSRLGFVTQSVTPGGCELHDNIFDYMGGGGAGAAALLMQTPDCHVHHNTFANRGGKSDAVAAAYTSAAQRNSLSRNLFIGFDAAVSVGGARSYITGGDNRFANCTTRYRNVSSGLADTDGEGDLVVPMTDLVDQFGRQIKPRRGVMVDSLARLDRKVPDFWGRFPPAGVGYIGALLER